MQQETEQNYSFLNRVEKLKLAQNWTWEETARQIGISRTMLHFIKSAKHGVTKKNWHRLEQAEKSFGMKPSTGASGSGVAQEIAAVEEGSRIRVSVEDIDKGYIDVPISYRRGSPPSNLPIKLKVTAPAAKTAAQALAAIKRDEDFTTLLSACLPREFSTPEFLNKLTPFSYNALIDVALAMTFGVNWKLMIRKR